MHRQALFDRTVKLFDKDPDRAVEAVAHFLKKTKRKKPGFAAKLSVRTQFRFVAVVKTMGMHGPCIYVDINGLSALVTISYCHDGASVSSTTASIILHHTLPQAVMGETKEHRIGAQLAVSAIVRRHGRDSGTIAARRVLLGYLFPIMQRGSVKQFSGMLGMAPRTIKMHAQQVVRLGGAVDSRQRLLYRAPRSDCIAGTPKADFAREHWLMISQQSSCTKDSVRRSR